MDGRLCAFVETEFGPQIVETRQGSDHPIERFEVRRVCHKLLVRKGFCTPETSSNLMNRAFEDWIFTSELLATSVAFFGRHIAIFKGRKALGWNKGVGTM